MRPLAVLTVGLLAAPAWAQQPARARPDSTTCNVQIDSSHGQSRYVKTPGGVYQTFAGGGIWAHCLNQPTTTMYSDSVAWYAERDLLVLLGHVHFTDTASVLDADRVTYHLKQERLYAEGHVFTRNLHTGSDLHGPNLDYYRTAPPLRDTLELFATSRPTIHFYSAHGASEPPAADTEPFVVVADRTHMKGNDRMWGGGHVTVDRSDLAARGDSAQLDLGMNRGVLIGGPPVVDGTGKDAYHLAGKVIHFVLTDGHDIREVLSSGDAVARGPDWRLDADTLLMTVDSGKVQRAQAWGKTKRPHAVSGVQTIDADSLDIHMPAQIVRLVWAYGHARTTSRDSTFRDTTVRRDTSLIRPDEDWLMGDTLRADFAVVDTGGTKKSQLEHLTSFGSARALYHVESADRHTTQKNVNYSRGRRIDIAMRESKVATVDVVGLVDAVYLEALPPKADTTRGATDSAGRAAADTARARTPADTSRTRAPADTARGRAPADTTARPVRKP